MGYASIVFEVTGNVDMLFNECGLVSLQRVPPTERKGRVHTSTVTVAVIDLDKYVKPDYSSISTNDLKVEWYSGSGAGGQHRNKHQNSCRLTHLPSGWTETAQCRSRDASYKQALGQMQRVLQNKGNYQVERAQSVDRKAQMGSGMRGDKIRTYRFQDDVATDHRTGRKVNLTKVMNGNFNLFW